MTHKFTDIKESKLFTKGGKVTLIIPPNIQVLMTGVQQIFKNKNRFCLCYTDGLLEEAICDKATGKQFMEIVSEVQTLR